MTPKTEDALNKVLNYILTDGKQTMSLAAREDIATIIASTAPPAAPIRISVEVLKGMKKPVTSEYDVSIMWNAALDAVIAIVKGE